MGVVSCVESEHDQQEEHHKDKTKTAHLSQKLAVLLRLASVLRRVVPPQLDLLLEYAIDASVSNINRRQRQPASTSTGVNVKRRERGQRGR